MKRPWWPCWAGCIASRLSSESPACSSSKSPRRWPSWVASLWSSLQRLSSRVRAFLVTLSGRPRCSSWCLWPPRSSCISAMSDRFSLSETGTRAAVVRSDSWCYYSPASWRTSRR
ncbi:ORFS343C.iORF1 [Human betaherpesvirus 5]|nr:ORFS343C.iORF1 [Human betaherpesvirus 5]QHX40705.1 ORFS343C.iORF1 [Human betaherpesvirus 5]